MNIDVNKQKKNQLIIKMNYIETKKKEKLHIQEYERDRAKILNSNEQKRKES